MASASVHPVDDMIMIRRLERNVTDGGIELIRSDDDPDRVMRGVIAATGPGMPTTTGERVPLAVMSADASGLVRVMQGDGVIYRAKDAFELTIESGKFDMIHFRDVVCVLKAE
jgi:co-chaperonin GroES (HSP10)